MVDEDSELEIEGISVRASPLMGERVPPARDHVSEDLSSPGLTIEEIVPESTPVDPVGGPSIREETNFDVPEAEVVSPVETTTEEETLPLVITRRAPREVTTSPVAIAADPVTEIVGINNFNNFVSVHALIIRQLVTEGHIKIVEVPEVEYEDAGRHVSILPQLIQNSRSYTDTQRADILYSMQQIAWPSFQESVD